MIRSIVIFAAAFQLVAMGSALGQQETTQTLAVTEKSTIRLGGSIGVANIEKMNTGTMLVGIEGDFAVADNFLVGGTFDYWRQEYDVNDNLRADVTDFALGAHSKLVFTNVRTNFRPFAMAGVAAHRLSVSESEKKGEEPGVDPYEDEFSDMEGQFGVDLGAGILYRVQDKVDLNGQIRWRNIIEDSVDYDQLAFTGGMAYLL